MDGGWLVRAAVGGTLAALLLYVLVRMAGSEGRRARHTEKRLDPFSDVTITR